MMPNAVVDVDKSIKTWETNENGCTNNLSSYSSTTAKPSVHTIANSKCWLSFQTDDKA